MDPRRPLPTTAPSLTVGDLVGTLARNWKRIAGTALLAGVVGFAASFLVRNKYTATTSFVAEQRRSGRLPGNLAGLASQFGIELGDEGGDSPQFYADVVRGNEIAAQLLAARLPDYRTDDPRDSAAVIELLGVEAESEARRYEKGREKLMDLLTVNVAQKTGIVTMMVTTRWPAMSRDLLAQYLATLNAFNIRRRNNSAAVRRAFAEERSREAQRELERREGQLRDFQARNRSFVNSPALQAEERSLERQISIAQDIYLAVRRQFEVARIDESNDTPVITVIDPPRLPGRKSAPSRGLIGVFATVLAAMLTSAWVLFRGLRAGPTPSGASRDDAARDLELAGV